MRTGLRNDDKCSECGFRFSAQLMPWNFINSEWVHNCDENQETIGDFLYRTDEEYRALKDKDFKALKRIRAEHDKRKVNHV